MLTEDQIVTKILTDERFCRSNNMQKFFKKKRNRHYWNVIRFEGRLWFASFGWLARSGKEDGFAGVKVTEVACFGSKAKMGYPSWQKGGDHEDVTEWFYERYFAEGMYGHFEIWHKTYPPIEKHAVFATI